MSAFNRLFALSGLTGLLGALALAIPANAAVKAQCLIDGYEKTDQTKPTPRKGVQLLGSSGTFSFTSFLTTCIDIASTKAPGTVHSGTVSASGIYKNRLVLPGGTTLDAPCGWGKVIATVTSQTLNPKFAPILGKKFAVEFGPMFGEGAFFWHDQGPSPLKSPPVPKLQPDPTDPGKTNPAGPKNYRYAGEIYFSPADQTAKDPVADLAKRLQPGNEMKCTKAFHLSGAVLVDEA
jgi:hypothetical protein